MSNSPGEGNLAVTSSPEGSSEVGDGAGTASSPVYRVGASPWRQRLEILPDRVGIAGQAPVGAVEPGEAPAPLLTHDTALDPASGGDGPEGRFFGEETGKHA